jgi:D-glycero-D-manno-heptose 1,7-bisphosphate phosphatase
MVVGANMTKAAFLDRDGVINKAVVENGMSRPPFSVEEIFILEGAAQAIELLKQNNYLPVVITNQPDVARGFCSSNQVQIINDAIGNLVGIEHFYTCLHDDGDACNCRKPKPGLIYESAKNLGVNIADSILVGDRWRDIDAGNASGLRCFFIDYSYNENMPKKPFTKVGSLLEAVHLIIGGSNAAEYRLNKD